MSPDRDHERPLALATDRPSSDEGDARASLSPRKQHRRRCILCCGACATLVAVLALVVLILAFTVFKVRDPRITMNSITLQSLSVTTLPLAVNMSVVADVSVKNPNAASFRFGGSTTSLYYRGGMVGVVHGPPGTAKAHRTFRINVTVDVMGDKLMSDPSLLSDLTSGSIGLSTSTKVGGRVKILGVVKHHVDVMMNCTLTVAIANQRITSQDCWQRVWL